MSQDVVPRGESTVQNRALIGQMVHQPTALCIARLMVAISVILGFGSTKGKMTAVAVICKQNEIVIAADSRRLNFTTGEQTSVCKIRDLKNVFVVASGIDTYPAAGYDVSNFLPPEMSEGSLETIVNSFEASVLPPCTIALEHLRKNNPDYFTRYALNIPPLNVYFARFEDHVPTVASFSVAVESGKDNPVVLASKKGRCPVSRFFFMPGCAFVGTREGRDHYLSLAKDKNFYDGNLIETARNFVQMEIDKQTPEIGGPIDILQLTKDGANWNSVALFDCPHCVDEFRFDYQKIAKLNYGWRVRVRCPGCGNIIQVVMLAYTVIHGCDPDKYKPGEIVEILPPDPNLSRDWRMAVNKLRMEILQKKTGWRPQGT